MAKESKLIDSIRLYINKRGGKVIKLHQSGFSEAGVPDLIIFLPSFGTLMLEAKAPGKVPTTLQLQKMKEINNAGGIAMWCDTFGGFLKVLDKFMNMK
jgi:Holliday junction resolvase